LLADLAVLDTRLRQMIEQVRREAADAEADEFRGLLIAEEDVDSWLSTLESADLGEPAGHEPGLGLETSPPPHSLALRRLAALFDLDLFDLRTVLTCLAAELHMAYSGLYAYIQDDVTRKHATVDLVLRLWCDGLADQLAARARFHAGAPLRRHRLVQGADDSGPGPLLTNALALDPRIVSFLLGSQELDPALYGVARLLAPAAGGGGEGPADTGGQSAEIAHLAGLAAPLFAQTVAWPAAPDTDSPGLLVVLTGPERGAKQEAARRLTAHLGCPLLLIDAPQLLATEGAPSLAARVDLAFREALLQPAVLFWRDADALLTPDPALVRVQATFRAALAGWPGCCLVDLAHDQPLAWSNPGPTILRLDFPLPSTQERRRLWTQALDGRVPLAPDVDLDLLAGSFRLSRTEIAAAAAAARHTAAWHGAGGITMRELFHACRAHSNQQLGLLARKIQPHYTWRDLVLPADRLAQLREMCNVVRYAPQVYELWGFDRKLSYGKGVNVLFSGAPGTGKTMAAEVLATDLGLDLYKVDLSSVVSKYIGETEKNLDQIFREARTSNAILFFDEADALFGKRSEVKDSHDRYANIETGYLLQKMEEYDGIVILATNLRKNMDEAFVRRLYGAIDFPMPEEEDRLLIWQTTFPPEAPQAPDVDLRFLAARFKLSGGNIKNIVVAAAFLAAEEGTAISMGHLVRATRRELQKIGKLALEADFGPYYQLVRPGT
jgi:AAA+ superfamily predicted ATPase